MNISKRRIDDCLSIIPEGRLDTTIAHELPEVLNNSLADVTELIFITEIRHATELVKAVFSITGMDSFFTIAD